MAGKLELPSFDISNENFVPQSIVRAQDVFVAIAEAELPSRIGTAYAQAVDACLTWIDPGSGDINAGMANTLEEGLEFKSAIIQSLLDVRI